MANYHRKHRVMDFGPAGSLVIEDCAKWSLEAKQRGLLIVGCSSGLVAQNGPNGTCHGAWFTKLNKGWFTARS